MLIFAPFLGIITFVIATATATTSSPTTTPATLTTITTTYLSITQPKGCPPSWTYNNATGFCYGIYHNMTWYLAEKKCIQEQAHLTSIHSKDEAIFVANLTEKYSTYEFLPVWFGQTYIGLVTNNLGQTWKWTDGTPLDYQHWHSGEPSVFGGEYERCGQLWSNRNYWIQFGDFNNVHCDGVIRNFVCKKLPN